MFGSFAYERLAHAFQTACDDENDAIVRSCHVGVCLFHLIYNSAETENVKDDSLWRCDPLIVDKTVLLLLMRRAQIKANHFTRARARSM